MILRCCFLSKVLIRLPSLCVILLPHPLKAQLVPLPGTNTGEPRSQERSKSVLGRLVSISFLLVRTWRKKGWKWTIFVFCVVPLRSWRYMCLVLVHWPEQCSSPPTWIWVRDLRHNLHSGIGFLRLLAFFLLLSVTFSWGLFIQSGTPGMPCYGMVSSRIRPLLVTLQVFNWTPLPKPNLHPNLSLCAWFPVGLLLPLDGLKSMLMVLLCCF